ncbi:hypothetical protein CHU93_15405 [Sandarakinorhabdus cyanobacteriorum]|uniref:N-acetyltransferase domain-containing protein n=1 Tax=Sandarakinorhabdus cyanobacteriorum TaxID=1981098 RepID=A0A255Y662_9SPHN|nr:GNAT family N-acetyltransferase [Sandarakinorhabdus cyanobacteriorum]OYQ24742.1 hypothetical protein CHU93_15405 [Sandarakinorhabdus cyanobacteriorum]
MIRLIPASAADLADPSPALLAGITRHYPTVDEGRAHLAEILAIMGARPRPAPWADWWALADDGSIKGLGGFKAPPDANGGVEIGYGTFPMCEGQGVATAIAAGLIAMARQHGARTIIAHTLMAENPSTTVLRRNGFAFVGTVIEPEDGEVWRWQLPLGPASA